MPSKMFIKDPQTGSLKTVVILRAWVDASGRQVFLHANGRYGYKDGSPLKSRAEIDIIGDPRQREQAAAWWDRCGAEESRQYYEALQRAIRDLAGDFRAELPDDTDLDAVLYARRPTGKKKGAISAPHTWMEWFPKRPDWWGQAQRVEFLDYAYEMSVREDATMDTLPAPEPAPDKKKSSASLSVAADDTGAAVVEPAGDVTAAPAGPDGSW